MAVTRADQIRELLEAEADVVERFFVGTPTARQCRDYRAALSRIRKDLDALIDADAASVAHT